MLNQSNTTLLSYVSVVDDDDIAVEEIIVNGDPVLGDGDLFDPSQLCSIQITG